MICLVVALGVAGVLPVFAAAAPKSCYVSVLQLKDPPLADYPDGEVSVEILNGYTRLFETPRKPLTIPGFTNRIRFSTAKSMPIRIVVRVWPAASGSKRPELKDGGAAAAKPYYDMPAGDDGDDLLGMGFDGLVTDYDTDVPDKRRAKKPDESAPPRPVKAKPVSGRGSVVLCELSVAWPPDDGVHALKCGTSTLEILTEMIGK